MSDDMDIKVAKAICWATRCVGRYEPHLECEEAGRCIHIMHSADEAASAVMRLLRKEGWGP